MTTPRLRTDTSPAKAAWKNCWTRADRMPADAANAILADFDAQKPGTL